MTRRALLIASQTFGLRGANNDAAAVDALLADRDFPDRRLLTDHAATREGILQAFRALIRDTAPGDPVLLYYSGHGGRIANPRHSPQSPREPAHYACIIPFDHTKEEFRGIFNSELSALLAELALRTANITVILDCCHAAAMTKDGARTKAIEIPWHDKVDAHRAFLLAQGYDLGARAAHVESNPHAIRLLACAADQLAFEACREDGLAGGMLTTALTAVLAEAPPDITWQALEGLVRARVTARDATQIPELHGPIGRSLFGTDEAPHTDVLTFTEIGGQPHLLGGHHHHVTRQSRYLLMPPNANRPDRDLALAEAEVLEIGPDTARVALAPIRSDQPPPLGTRAFLHDPKLKRHPVRLDLPTGPLRDLLAATITDSPRIHLATAETEEPTLATLSLEGDLLVLTDDRGHRVRHPWPIDHVQASSVDPIPPIAMMEQLARVRDLLCHPEPVGPTRFTPEPRIRWGVLRDGAETLLEAAEARLQEGDRIFVRVTSQGGSAMHVNILGVDVSRTISILSASQPRGIKLEAERTYTLGDDSAGALVGIPLRWHEDVPRGAPQPMAMLVLISDLPLDLRSLESSAAPRHLARSLDELVDPSALLVYRDHGEAPRQAPRTRYSRRLVHFYVSAALPP